LVRSTRTAAAGAVILFASYAAMLVVLPGVSPFQLTSCATHSPAQAPPASECLSLNPIYPVVFLVSIGGTVALFVGGFGRRFVVGPVFVAGMVALEYGLAGVVSATLSGKSEGPTDPIIFTPLISIGAAVVCFHAYRWLRLQKA
jgi:hypothetical protein